MNNMIISMITNTDSYKFSQWEQYPEGIESVYSYGESRINNELTVYFGMQAFVNELVNNPVTLADINIAEKLVKSHGMPFNREGWERLVDKHKGYLPLVIKSAPEGSVIPSKNVLFTVENTDPEFYWLTSYVETALLRAIWYPTTVATTSFKVKKLLHKWLKDYGDVSALPFMLHDFGARGASSRESAMIGGAAHLVNFMGTDTFESLAFILQNYGYGDNELDACGFSVPASEHSTMTSWGKENEVDAYENMVTKFGDDYGIVSVVSDSYDIYEACRMWNKQANVIKSKGFKLVVRPDSGDPKVVVPECLKILERGFGSTVQSNGLRVLHNVGILWGDGISPEDIEDILDAALIEGFSPNNFVFGMGGGLLQKVNRDTLKFAMKCSSVKVNGEHRNVFKDPITDPGKVSKAGRWTLYHNEKEGFFSGVEDWPEPALRVVYENGISYNQERFEVIRERANKPFEE